MNIIGIANIKNDNKWLIIEKLRKKAMNKRQNSYSLSESLEYVKDNLGDNSLVLQMEMIQSIIV